MAHEQVEVAQRRASDLHVARTLTNADNSNAPTDLAFIPRPHRRSIEVPSNMRSLLAALLVAGALTGAAAALPLLPPFRAHAADAPAVDADEPDMSMSEEGSGYQDPMAGAGRACGSSASSAH